MPPVEPPASTFGACATIQFRTAGTGASITVPGCVQRHAAAGRAGAPAWPPRSRCRQSPDRPPAIFSSNRVAGRTRSVAGRCRCPVRRRAPPRRWPSWSSCVTSTLPMKQQWSRVRMQPPGTSSDIDAPGPVCFFTGRDNRMRCVVPAAPNSSPRHRWRDVDVEIDHRAAFVPPSAVRTPNNTPQFRIVAVTRYRLDMNARVIIQIRAPPLGTVGRLNRQEAPTVTHRITRCSRKAAGLRPGEAVLMEARAVLMPRLGSHQWHHADTARRS